MDKREARLILQAWRPGGADQNDPAFAEAMKFAANDPELRAWWEAQHAFDYAVTIKLAEVPVPDSLRDTILSGRRRKVVPMPPQPKVLGWLAAAAVIGILCVAMTFLQIAKHGPVERDDFTEASIKFLGDDSPPLDLLSDDHNKIAGWLKQQNAPMGTLPEKMAAVPSVGCQKFVLHGHTVSLICFEMKDGKIAHLFVLDEDAMRDPPHAIKPEFREYYGWHLAQWSDGKMTYLLATRDDEKALRQLL